MAENGTISEGQRSGRTRSGDRKKQSDPFYNDEQEWRFVILTAVVFDAHYGRLIVCDIQRNRLQIYNEIKNEIKEYQQAARTI
jgi:hypothetical protein